MRVVLPCGGDGARWQNYTGGPKQLAPDDRDEPVLLRTLRLGTNYADDRWVVATDARICDAVSGRARCVPPLRFEPPAGVDKVLSSAFLWHATDATVVLFGDCYFSRFALHRMLGSGYHPLSFFGRLHPSALTGKTSPEVYALRFEPRAQPQLLACAVELRRQARAHPTERWKFDSARGIMLALQASDANAALYTIDDWTEDFDKPRDWLDWRRRRIARMG